MRAAVIDRYGGSEEFTIRDVPVPLVNRGEVRIRVKAACVNPVDWKLRSGHLRLYSPQQFPLVLGFDVAGELDEIGEGVTGWSQGDPVYSYMAKRAGGGYAEFCVTPARALARKPERFSFDQAAATPMASLTALQGLRDKCGLSANQSVLVNGASGGVGMFVVQIAKIMGARVTGVCSTKNADWVADLGADEVIPYDQQDFTKGSSLYDVVYDAVGTQSFSTCRRVLRPGGTYLTTLPGAGPFFWQVVAPLLPGRRRALWLLARPRGRDLSLVTDWVQAGKLRVVIDSTFQLDDIGDAHRRSETGRSRGKIVIRV